MGQSPCKSAADLAGEEMSSVYPQISEENLQQFIDFTPIPAFVVDIEYNFVCVNSNACEFLGFQREELLNKKITDVIRSENTERQLSNAQAERIDWEFSRKDGSSVWGEVSSRLLKDKLWLVFVSDIFGRKQAEKGFLDDEERRWQTQKIEALGRLAGGIAHDFNNFLAVILLHIDMLNLQLPAESPFRHRVNEIKAVSNNAAAVVRQLLAFGRKQPLNPSPIVLNNPIKEFSKILRSLIGENIKVEMNLDPDLGVCFVDQNQVAQVLANLALNAKDAMLNGGTLKIETSNVVLDRAETHKSQSGGSYVQIIIADDGAGMDSNTKEHIFEPFFSTKESDKGAGLGLATVYGFIKQSNGFIWVESKINDGTSFKIQFPRIDQPIQTAERKPEIVQPLPEGNTTILLVDDEEMVRKLTAEVLRMSGFEVFEAASGMEALEIAQTSNKPFALLLTDFSMPIMNGQQVAEKITAMHPQTSVLFMSGDIEGVISRQNFSEDEFHFIGKPFSPFDLAVKVSEILEK
jgi:two-component system cell cycle sensor histidine kinase/response regulator CckA